MLSRGTLFQSLAQVLQGLVPTVFRTAMICWLWERKPCCICTPPHQNLTFLRALHVLFAISQITTTVVDVIALTIARMMGAQIF